MNPGSSSRNKVLYIWVDIKFFHESSVELLDSVPFILWNMGQRFDEANNTDIDKVDFYQEALNKVQDLASQPGISKEFFGRSHILVSSI